MERLQTIQKHAHAVVAAGNLHATIGLYPRHARSNSRAEFLCCRPRDKRPRIIRLNTPQNDRASAWLDNRADRTRINQNGTHREEPQYRGESRGPNNPPPQPGPPRLDSTDRVEPRQSPQDLPS